MRHAPPGRIKSGKASLIGGIVVGVASFVLWAAITRDLGVDTVPCLVTGLVVSGAIGTWIRIADL